MKVVTIVGARPQFIKSAVVSRAFMQQSNIQEFIVHTGQHFDENMSDVFFNELSIPKPHCNLSINGGSHGAMTGKMLEGIESVLQEINPDWVLVYGDTNSTLAGALAAKKMHIKVAHVEAGLRSYNMRMPEEVNRIITDRISDLLFCPTDQAINNLVKEGFNNINAEVINVGDVMYDAAMFYADKAKKPDFTINGNFILATIHRAENSDNPTYLKNIIQSFESIAAEEGCEIIVPLHPRTQDKLRMINYEYSTELIRFVNPVGYLEMIYLLKNAKFVMTDSGGLQKEAYFFDKLCLTLRNETEWVELVNHGFNFIGGNNLESISEGYKKLKSKMGATFGINLYGDGNASKKIVDTMLKYNSPN